MYERRKVLLGLVEAFGGELARTDCIKLLFLLSQRQGGRCHYDFFPHHYGPYSHVAIQDKRRLTDQGLLRDVRSFAIAQTSQYLGTLRRADRLAIGQLRSQVGATRGRDLLRRVYLDYPAYCSRSKILDRVLNEDERFEARAAWNSDRHKCLFTIGYQGHTVDSFVRCLVDNNIDLIIDVRRNASSMKYGFSKRVLQELLASSGVSYVHVPELGIDNALRKSLESRDSYLALMQVYRRDMLPYLGSELLKISRIVDAHRRAAIMCFEFDHECCHRHVVAEAIAAARDGKLPIVHLSGSLRVSA